MATYTTTTKHALRALLGANQVLDIDAGFLALAEDIDAIMAVADSGPIASRPVSTPVSPGKVGRFYRSSDGPPLSFDYGIGWLDIETRQDAVAALPTTGLYTGREALYQDAAMITAGIPPWRFRYNAASASTYKWEAMGLQEPLRHNIDGATGMTGTGGVFVDSPGTVGPTLTTSLAGDWGYRMQAGFTNNSASAVGVFIALSVGGVTPVNIGDPMHIACYLTTNADRDVATRENRINGLASGTVIKMMYQWATSVNPIRRTLEIWPIRVI